MNSENGVASQEDEASKERQETKHIQRPHPSDINPKMILFFMYLMVPFLPNLLLNKSNDDYQVLKQQFTFATATVLSVTSESAVKNAVDY